MACPSLSAQESKKNCGFGLGTSGKLLHPCKALPLQLYNGLQTPAFKGDGEQDGTSWGRCPRDARLLSFAFCHIAVSLLLLKLCVHHEMLGCALLACWVYQS